MLRDERESALVRQRSGGRCEMPLTFSCRLQDVPPEYRRCQNRATEVHHLLGGSGIRGRGDSALASHKVHACQAHHRQIHDHRIRLTWDAANPFATLKVEQ